MPLDAEFFGPLSPADADRVPELIALLLREPFKGMPWQRAGGLLESPNPWVAWLGLVRLQELGLLEARHFARALPSRAPADIDGVVFEAFVALWGDPTARASLAETLLTVSGTPDQQREVVKSVRDACEQDIVSSKEAKEEVTVKLRETARGYRASIVNDPSRREVVAELDFLIASLSRQEGP